MQLIEIWLLNCCELEDWEEKFKVLHKKKKKSLVFGFLNMCKFSSVLHIAHFLAHSTVLGVIMHLLHIHPELSEFCVNEPSSDLASGHMCHRLIICMLNGDWDLPI